MLEFKVRLSEPREYTEIKCDNLYLSPDMDYISGVTNVDYCLCDGQKLLIELDENSNFVETIANVKDVERQGVTSYKQIFNLEDYNDYKCFRYADGKYYFSNKEKTSITVNGESYQIKNNTVEVPVLYYVEDGKLEIGDYTYKIDIILKRELNKENYEYVSDITPKISLKSGEELSITIWDRNKWEKKTKFILRKNNDYKLDIDYISHTDKKYYFEYGMKDNSIIRNYFDYRKSIFTNSFRYETDTIDGKTFYAENINNEFTGIIKNCDDDNDSYKNLSYDWVNCGSGKFLNLFVDDSKFSFESKDTILVESSTKLPIRSEIITSTTEDSHFVICGKKYYISEEDDTVDYAIINDKEYKIKYTDEKWGIENLNVTGEKYGYIFINFFNEPTPLIINGDECTIYSIIDDVAKKTYPMIKYRYVNVGNEKIIVKKYNRSNGEEYEYIDFYQFEKYTLVIDDVISGNLLRCHPDLDNDDYIENACNSIVSNKSNFNFYLINSLYPKVNVSKEGFFDEMVMGKGTAQDKIGIFNFTTLFNIPLLMSNEYENNLNQADIVNKYFAEKEIEKSINPYVDMEREIYYPCYKEGDAPNSKFTTVNDISFSLHFRSRNLEKWKINEDIYQNLIRNGWKKNSSVKCDWNFFDYYRLNAPIDENDKRIHIQDGLADSFSYHQPSDLLYFLNFNDDDIFYQKNKVGKSFLRLSFFNSNDTMNQSLLYTCTIFVDEGKLFKKYLDCMAKKDLKYVSINGMTNVEGKPLLIDTISTSFDTSDDDGNVTFIKDRRLDATISVNNRYESHESAEGFYLYIFKEYCEKLHEEPIYMKIDFNHAGEGRTINMTIPFKIDENGQETLLNFNEPDDIRILKEGISLDELYKHMFIRLESVYDDKNNRYCYYLPSWMNEYYSDDKKSILYNLYELKIKDESK